jgi:hypothetical protein
MGCDALMFTLKMEAAGFFEILVFNHKSIRCHNPEDLDVYVNIRFVARKRILDNETNLIK